MGYLYSEEEKIQTFKLPESFIKKFKGKQPKWGPVGYFVYKRTYARPVDRDKPEGQTEEFWQTCRRVVETTFTIQKLHCEKLNLPWTKKKAVKSAKDMYERMWEFKFLPPGRGLWAMDLNLLNIKGGAPLNNCGFVTTENIDINFAEPFCFLMDLSMLGVGIGSDTKGAGKVDVQRPEYSDETWVVEDTREGWVDLIRCFLGSVVGECKFPKNVDYSNVRSKGSVIKTFGGKASGPEPLIILLENLKKIYDFDEPTPITSELIVDTHNFIGKCVVAGGVRRTAEIMFGDYKDEVFLELKHDDEALNDRRWASNNSIFAEIGMDYKPVAERTAVRGEPGYEWLENARAFSRMGHPPDYKDRKVKGANPCVEQSLEDHELCCLVETFPANHETEEDFKKTLKAAYLYAKTVTLVPTHNKITNSVLMRNRRIGCSLSGIVQAMTKFGRRVFLNWCDNGYDELDRLDKIYSDWLCIPLSIKKSSVKPSGTVSKLPGVFPGIHYPEDEYYLQRIRVADTSPLIQACVDAGYPVEKAVAEPDTYVVTFPVKENLYTKGKYDVSIWEQVANAIDIQRHWADNQVSITVTFQDHERDQIVPVLEFCETRLKGMSFLPLPPKGSGTVYPQQPMEYIDKEGYENLMRNITPLDLSKAVHEVNDVFCDGDACLIES